MSESRTLAVRKPDAMATAVAGVTPRSAARVLFATDAGGVGLNLQRAASCCINLDLPWNPAVLEQRIGRVHRFGQTRPVEVYALVADGGIEARIAGLVGDKKALFRGLFDGTSDTVDFAHAGSFLSRIEQLIERPVVPPSEDGDGSAADTVADDSADTADTTDTTSAALAALPSATAALGSVNDLLGQMTFRTLPGGRLSIEAPPEAASVLAAMLRTVATILDSQAG